MVGAATHSAAFGGDSAALGDEPAPGDEPASGDESASLGDWASGEAALAPSNATEEPANSVASTISMRISEELDDLPPLG